MTPRHDRGGFGGRAAKKPTPDPTQLDLSPDQHPYDYNRGLPLEASEPTSLMPPPTPTPALTHTLPMIIYAGYYVRLGLALTRIRPTLHTPYHLHMGHWESHT